MKLNLNLSGAGGDKKQKTVAIGAILVLLIAIGFLARQFMGGGAPPPAPSTGPPTSDIGALPPGEVPMAPPGGAPAGGGPPGTMGNPASGGVDAGVPGSPGPAPTADAGAQPSAGQATAPPPPTPAPAPPPPTKDGMRQLTVFGSVRVSYPADWKISAGKGNAYAIFTDGNASFAVHPPDSRADSAKKIAMLAMQRLAPGATVVKEGADNVSSHNAYWFAVKYQGRTARVVGIDGPTRIALVETVKTGDFAAYRSVFDKMQSNIGFSSN